MFAEIGKFQIAFVARADEVSDLNLFAVRERHDRGAHRSTLAHEPRLSWLHIGLVEHLADGGNHIVPQIGEADRIGSDETNPFTQRQRGPIAVAGFSFVAELGVSGR